MNILKQETKKQVKSATEKKTREGICRICIHESYCAYRKSISGPVLQCEECEYSESAPVKNITGVITFLPKLSDSTVKVDGGAGKFKGLCVNCDDREVCVYPKPEGGIWHCEEYR